METNTPKKRSKKPRRPTAQLLADLKAKEAALLARAAREKLKGSPLFAIVKKLQAAQGALEDVVTHLPDTFDPDTLKDLIEGLGIVIEHAAEGSTEESDEGESDDE